MFFLIAVKITDGLTQIGILFMRQTLSVKAIATQVLKRARGNEETVALFRHWKLLFRARLPGTKFQVHIHIFAVS